MGISGIEKKEIISLLIQVAEKHTMFRWKTKCYNICEY